MGELRVSVKCPFCRRSLMSGDKILDGHPSVRVVIQYGEKPGFLFLSSIYGSFSIDSEIDVPPDEMVLFFCPLCHSSLLTGHLCERCHAPMALFELQSGGNVEICSRRGCKEHFIEFSNLAQKTSALYDIYEVFAHPYSKKSPFDHNKKG